MLKRPCISTERGGRPTYKNRRHSVVRKPLGIQTMLKAWWCFLWDGSKAKTHCISIAGKDTSSLSQRQISPAYENTHVLIIKVSVLFPCRNYCHSSTCISLFWRPSSKHTCSLFLDKFYLCNNSLCRACYFFLVSQGGLKRYHKNWVSPSALEQIQSLNISHI